MERGTKARTPGRAASRFAWGAALVLCAAGPGVAQRPEDAAELKSEAPPPKEEERVLEIGKWYPHVYQIEVVKN